MKKINDIIELGSGDKYQVEAIENYNMFGTKYSVLHSVKLTSTGKKHSSLFAQLQEKDGSVTLVRTYRA